MNALAPRNAAPALLEMFFAGRNESTLRAYRADVEDFRQFVGVATAHEAAHCLVDAAHGEANALALAYRAHMVRRGLQAATINRRLAALRSLVKLANTIGLVPWSLKVSNVKAQAYRDTRGPGVDGFRAMLAVVETRADAKGLRDVALVRLLHDCGLRRGEVVGLDLEDVDMAGRRVFVRGKGKTDKQPVTLPVQTRDALGAWLDVRGPTPGPLFINMDRARKGSGRLAGASVHEIIKRVGEQAGLRVRPHGLRHLAITTALDLTRGDMRAVQRFSRHADVRVIGVYDDARVDMGGEVAQKVANSVKI